MGFRFFQISKEVYAFSIFFLKLQIKIQVLLSELIKMFSNVSVATSRIPIEAGNLRIQCDVADDSTSSIAWFKDNKPLDDTLPNVAFEDDFRRLVLLAFGPSDRGVYMCLTGGQNWHSAAQELIYVNSGTIYSAVCSCSLS